MSDGYAVRYASQVPPRISYRVTSDCLTNALHRHDSSIVLVQQRLQEAGSPNELGSSHAPSVGIRLVLAGLAFLRGKTIDRGRISALQRLLDDHGPGQLNAITGDFTLCYVAPDASRLVAIRSVTGTRSVYFRRLEAGLICATDPRALLAGCAPSLEDVNTDILPAIVAGGDVDPRLTSYRHVSRLPAGWQLVASGGELERYEPYDTLCARVLPRSQPLEAVSNEIRSRTEAAVGRSVRALRSRHNGLENAAVLLSAGLDSAIVAYEAKKHAERVVGVTWTWPSILPMRPERERAERLCVFLGIEGCSLDLAASVARNGDYGMSMGQTINPFAHGFFKCFQESASAAGRLKATSILTGHLGDAAFETSFENAARTSLTLREPRMKITSAISTLQNLSLSELGTVLWPPLWKNRPEMLRRGSLQRVRLSRRLLTARAFARALEEGGHVYMSDAVPRSSLSTYDSLMKRINGDGELDSIITGGLLHPRRIALAHPYADRPLLEYCLGLRPDHRSWSSGGYAVSKPLLRLAYAGSLPPDVVSLEVRSAYASIDETWCRNNAHIISSALSSSSLLAQMGVIDPARVHIALHDTHLRDALASGLVRALGVELWLQAVAACAQQRPAVRPTNG